MSEDINLTDGTLLEALNGKADLDFGNVTEAGKAEAVSWGRQFVASDKTIFSGAITSAAGTYNLGFTDGKVKIGVFNLSVSTAHDGHSNIAIKTDVMTSSVSVCGANNGHANPGAVALPFINAVTLSAPSTSAGGTATVILKGYY